MLLCSIFASALMVLGVVAQENAVPEGFTPADQAGLKADLLATFPDADEVFGLKLVNGRPTRMNLDVTNYEDTVLEIAFVGGALYSPDPPAVNEDGVLEEEVALRNLTTTTYGIRVEPGEKATVQYSFALDMHPQNVRLRILAFLVDDRGSVYKVLAYNSSAAIVEPPTSLLDPQIIFLYLVLMSVFGATLYFIYKTWIEALFPQTKRSKHAAGSSKKSKKSAVAAATVVEHIDAAIASGAENALTSGKEYDESWIPDHHIKRPVAKRVKGKTGKKAAE